MPAQEQDKQPDPNTFDLTVHKWDSRGHLKAVNPYRLHFYQGAQYYERPVNSGNLWYENNQPAGRVKYNANREKSFEFKAPHVTYVKPLAGAEKITFENLSLKEQNAQLMKELQQIKADQAKAAAEKLATPPTQSNKAPVPQGAASVPLGQAMGDGAQTKE